MKLDDSDLTAQRFHVAEVEIAGLDLHVRKERDGTLNLAHLAPGGGEPAKNDGKAKAEARAKARTEANRAKKTKEPEAGPRFALDRFTLKDTAVHFRDDSVEPAFVTDVRDIHVAVRGLSNAPGVTATVEAGLRAMPGGGRDRARDGAPRTARRRADSSASTTSSSAASRPTIRSWSRSTSARAA